MNEKALEALMEQRPFGFLQNPEIVLMVENDGIAVNISAITGVDSDLILKEHSCVGLSATKNRLNDIYEFVCAGGKYEDYGVDLTDES